jgi:putative ABC transport system permease protein
MTNLWRNLHFGVRMLRKNPGFSFVAVLALALGIGANTAIFSVMYGTLYARLPYRDPERLASVWSMYRGQQEQVSPQDYLDWKRDNTVFEGLGALSFQSATVAHADGTPQAARIALNSPGFIDILGIPMLFGRDFLPEEGQPGKDNVAILSYEYWRDRFASDRNVLGRKVRVNGEGHTIIGVYGPQAGAERERILNLVTVPLAFKPEDITRDNHWLMVQGRLKPGITVERANAEMQTLGRRMSEANPTTNKGWDVRVERRQNEFVSKDLRRTLWLLMSAVCFVLLIACANVANLMLARGTVRQKELAVRTSLGATRSQLVSQLLTESLLLAFLGAALGVGLSWALLKVILALMPPYTLPGEADIRLQLPVLLFTLTVTAFSAVLAGSAPALQSLGINPNETLKEGGAAGAGMRGRGLRRTLVVAEFALALTLLAGAGLAIHGFWKAAATDLGFRSDHILTFYLQVSQGRLSSPQLINGFYRELLGKIQAIPGVSAASASGGISFRTRFRLPFTIAGKPVSDAPSNYQTDFNMATPGYFQTFGLQIERGRFIGDQDTETGAHVAVVNRAFVNRYFAGADPLLQQVAVARLTPGTRKPGPPVFWQIVGVYRDVKNEGLDEPFPEIDVPFAQSPWPAVMAVRTAGDPAEMRKSIAAAVQSVDQDLPMSDVETMDDIVHESWANERFGSALFGSFAAVALLLAAFGIYGVMAFAAAQRTREIGLRLALGAGRNQILRLFVLEGMVLGLIGLGVGIGGVYAVGRLMHGMWYGTSTGDPIIFAAVAGVLLAAALLAWYIPARRAANVDPMVALRYE